MVGEYRRRQKTSEYQALVNVTGTKYTIYFIACVCHTHTQTRKTQLIAGNL